MKKIVLILLFSPLLIMAQGSQKKIKKLQFKVEGNCKMCKKTIEKAALSIKGVKMAKWDIPSNELSLIYDPRKVQLSNIDLSIAQSGYDTSETKATEEDYDDLPVCCKYNRKKQ
jgi:cation transport ATPase